MLVTMKETVNSWTSSPQCVAGGGGRIYCLLSAGGLKLLERCPNGDI